MVHASTQATQRKEDLRDFIIKLYKKEAHIRAERQRLEAELMTLVNRELLETLKNSNANHFSETKVKEED